MQWNCVFPTGNLWPSPEATTYLISHYARSCELNHYYQLLLLLHVNSVELVGQWTGIFLFRWSKWDSGVSVISSRLCGMPGFQVSYFWLHSEDVFTLWGLQIRNWTMPPAVEALIFLPLDLQGSSTRPCLGERQRQTLRASQHGILHPWFLAINHPV